MRGEKLGNEFAGLVRAEGIRDEKVGSRGGCSLHGRGVCADLPKCGGQAFRIPGKKRTRGIREKFAATGDGKLNEIRSKRRQDDSENPRDCDYRPGFAVAVSPAA